MEENTQNQVTEQTTIIDAETSIKADIEKLKAAKTDLQEKGSDLFVSEIKNIDEKIKDKEILLEKLKTKATGVLQATETEASNWWANHKADIFNVAKIAALIYIAFRLTM
ncbi:hypothetical protein [Pectinatus frisingensis]|uniref:hypothetical protein n=1 Tax=Pectinatus frisingensis TaxID=865 RepID=UPI0018C80C28|nr:hypothetical protein [Pectinatus frisingensis]